MTFPEFINYVLLAGIAVLGWFARELWGAVKDLRLDMINLKDYVAQNYTRKDDFKDFREDSKQDFKDFRVEILTVLQRIESRLDTKQDK